MGLVIESGYTSSVPLDHPRILWNDVARRRSAVVASTEVAGFEGANAFDYLTFDYWKPSTLPATLELQLSVAEEVDSALIAAHSLGSDECQAKLQYHNGADWVDLTSEISPADDNVAAFLFPSVTASRFRLSVDSDASPAGQPVVGVLMIGQALALQRRIYRGHTPITMGRRTTVRPQLSEGGQWLGRSIRREGVATDIALTNLTAEWVRANLDPFIEAARTYPFGWFWRPDGYPAEVALVWTSGDIVPTNSGPRDLMSVSFAVEGHP